MEKILEATLANGLFLFREESCPGEYPVRFGLSTEEEGPYCNNDECLPFYISGDTYRVILEACGGISHYYTRDGEEYLLEEYLYYGREKTHIFCDTYFKTRDEAFEAAKILTKIFKTEGSTGLVEYANQWLAELWDEFGDVTLNDEEQINSSFYIWPAGTDKEVIWHWFDRSHSKGLAEGLMGL